MPQATLGTLTIGQAPRPDVVPIAGQIESEAGKWRALARPPIFATASPYTSPPEAVGDAGATLKSRGAEAILLD